MAMSAESARALPDGRTFRRAPCCRVFSDMPGIGWILGTVLTVALASAADAQMHTLGLFVNDEQSSEGYTLFGPKYDTTVYLITNDGLVAHAWQTDTEPNAMGYLLPNGDLIRAASRPAATLGLRIQEFDWEGNVVWDFSMDNSQYRQHHDIEPLPNGNVLIIARETKTAAEAIAAGRDPLRIDDDIVRPDAILEIRPVPPNDGEIVWEWHVWDHLVQDFDLTKENFGVVADHPELIDINFGPTDLDWTHCNGIHYDTEFDQIIITVRKFSELWVIDHSTTTEEAAGHTGGDSGKGGDILYRWGNPAAYDRGTEDDQKLWGPHDATRISPGFPGGGNILIFNNGFGLPWAPFSSVDEIVPPVDAAGAYSIAPDAPFGPADPIWSYSSDPPYAFYSANTSGAERLPNGTTLICESMKGHLFEVTAGGEVVWDYVNPVGSDGPVPQGDPIAQQQGNLVFKVRRYPPDFPAFAGKDLTPGDPIELFNAPFPVPDPSLAASTTSGVGDPIQLEWDASTCTSFDYHLLYGPLSAVSAYELSGSECNIGTSGSHTWTDTPPGSLYFLVVGTDDSGVYESSWGRDSFGGERNGTGASFHCGTTTKVVSSTCP